MKKRILVGMSGGVDSSVSAILLQEQGYEVVGATMVLFDSDDINEGCLSSSAVNDAKKVCQKLGIEHHVIDLKDYFKKYVINNFVENYKNGMTPNPCVQCNKYLKFGALFDKAKELKCEYIATGHYARVEDGYLKKSNADKKDQTYFLYGIKKEVLPYIVFPLKDFKDKEEIREIAKKHDLFVATKKDSQEICFIPNDDYKSYLEKKIKPIKGNFVDSKGNILGTHKGIIYYTIGQRKGLGISAKQPLYVTNINKTKNEITLGTINELYKDSLIAKDINLLVDEIPKNITAKIRYRSNNAKCSIELLDNNTMKIIFDEPQKSITKGQSVVLYSDDIVVGGGIIFE